MKLLKDDPWTVSQSEFPRANSVQEQLRFLLNYAVLAPSGHNTQPWLFRIEGDGVDIIADRRRALAVVDPNDRELTMSCGTALFHLRVAMRHFGFAPVVQLFPEGEDADVMARIRMGASMEPVFNTERLFMAIANRRTNRQPFTGDPVPAAELEHFATCAAEEGASLRVVKSDAEKHALAELIAEGDRIQASDKRFRRELAAWVHPNRSNSRDGIPGYAMGLGDLLSYAGPFVIRTFNWGEGQAAKDQQLAEGSPVLLVISTSEDSPRAWMAAGQALDRVLLQGQAYDLQASYLNQPIEVPELRPKVAERLGIEGVPQLILRMGYPTEPVETTPRRSAADMLLEGDAAPPAD